MSTYKPIDCGWYDHFEAYATRGTELMISYTEEDGKTKEFVDKIVDLQTRNKEEFAIFSSGLKLRLDQIITLNPLKNDKSIAQ